jgi:hypothetical protein
VYGILLLCWGYQFGRGDLIQLDPLVLHSANPQLFDNDLYVEYATATFPNERYFFLLILQPFAGQLEWASFLLHFIFSVILFSGLYHVAGKFIHHHWLRTAIPLLLFIPLYGINLGDNELYYGIFHPSLVAKAIGVWAIYYWLNNSLIVALCLSAIATLFHPVAGLQVFTLISGAAFFYQISVRKNPFSRSFLIGIGIWFFTAGLFLLAIHKRFEGSTEVSIDLYYIFYIFRNPHHYIPDAFPQKNWFVLTPLILAGWLLYFKQDRRLFIFFLVAFTGLAIYVAGIYASSTTITTFQWFKSTIWLEMLAVIAVVSSIEALAMRYRLQAALPVLSITLPVIWAFAIHPSYNFMRDGQRYDLPFIDYTDDAIDISRQAKEKTPVDALFIQPCHFSELKYFGERASYVDYKALTHTQQFLSIWWTRLEEVYHLDAYTSPPGYNTCAFADQQFQLWDSNSLLDFQKTSGVTHILTYREHLLDFPVVAGNATYIIYAIE